MEMPNPPTQCDCLQGEPTTYTFGDRFTNIPHVNEQIVRINHHIHELIELRSALLHRSNQLQSLFYVIPPEVISHIFQEAVRVISNPSRDLDEGLRYADLKQAFVLSSVSRGFRQIALGTPQLWNKLEFGFYSAERAINKFVPRLQHCVSHISSLYLGVNLRFGSHSNIYEEHVRLVTQTLFSPEIALKLKHLALHGAPRWILTACLLSFPVVETLAINGGSITDLNLEALPVSRVSLNLPRLESITLPPSVQVLNLDEVSGHLVISIPDQQCPTLAECSTGRGCSTSRHSITLHHLKQLTWSSNVRLQTIRNLRLPCLERLRLSSSFSERQNIDTTVISFCEQVSTTLISLDLGGYASFGDDGLQKLCTLKFPHLEEFKIQFFSVALVYKATEALLFQAESENNNPGIKYMPNLSYLSLTSIDTLLDRVNHFPRLFLDLLKLKRLGEATDFHLDLNVRHIKGDNVLWPLELREELESIIHGRNLRLTRCGDKFEWLR